MSEIQIETGRGTMPTYLALPSTKGPWPGVVVIHDAFGAGQNLQRHADWLASCGYLAAAPNLFHWNSRKIACIRAVMREAVVRKGPTFDAIEATRIRLRQDPDCTGRIGIIGFCMGGAFSMLLAPSGGYDAAAPNYGQVPKDAEAFFAGACPVVGSFGRRDPTLRGAAQKLEHALTANGVVHDVKEYPHCSHGFLDDHAHDKLPLPLVVLKKVLNIGYEELPAEDARSRIQAFFDEHLKG